ncbi:DcaP family trimeric outer membrane transporter [Flavicella marina]|uniref:DcaP family trimeric outer membrane transporter n=1 Tax=Flavicella marina TaxID=1475951 RepID=UPI0012658CE4|nr:DcaP family trimeric outer membrane transporter [Flavicella marina]
MKKKLLFLTFLINIGIVAQHKTKNNDTNFTIGGFAKMDAMITVFEGGEVADPESPIRDIHLPSAIPVGGQDTYDTHMHIKESRFYLDFEKTLKNEKKIKSYFEMDFLLSAAGDARVSNSYNPRIRHLYINYDKWLFGQTWSTFMVVIIPDDLDFSGAAEGIVFNRQPQIRYTNGNWQFSLEVPEATITPNGGGPFVISSGGLPDAIVRRNFNGKWGNLGVSGIIRNPRYHDANGTRKSFIGYGLTSGAKINIGKKDDLRIQATYGYGLGRYLALAFLNSSVVDNNGDLQAISSMNGFVSYLHHWNDRWKSSINYSFLEAQNPTELAGLNENKNAWSGSANIIYQADKDLLLGVEGMYAYRGLENGIGDGMHRVQFSVKYSFKYSAK